MNKQIIPELIQEVHIHLPSENEVTETGGGRVFYVLQQIQDGNFRVGELFGVTQATGVVTIQVPHS